jgi:transposase-like protein
MKRKRRSFTPEEKVMILKRHLVDKVPVSNLCDELGLQPTVFYRWQTEFFEKGALAFTRPLDSRQRKQELRIKELEEKLQRKHEVLSELIEEHVQLKKNLGEI